MGRKIPAKKHRGVKDPIEQQARRLKSLKSKINAPPSAGDEQPVPRSLQRLFAPRQPRASRPSAPRASPLASVAALRRLAGESARGFSQRIGAAVRALHDDAPGYPLDDDDDDERAPRRGRRPPAAPARAAPARAAARSLRLQIKKKAKEEKAEQAAREVVYERVPFGVVAAAPPALRAAARPGRRALLLDALLRPAPVAPVAPVAPIAPPTPPATSKKRKKHRPKREPSSNRRFGSVPETSFC